MKHPDARKITEGQCTKRSLYLSCITGHQILTFYGNETSFPGLFTNSSSLFLSCNFLEFVKQPMVRVGPRVNLVKSEKVLHLHTPSRAGTRLLYRYHNRLQGSTYRV
jgi:hypothetical protein